MQLFKKNTRFPTDARLYNRAITRLMLFAMAYKIVIRQTYIRVSKKLLREQQNFSHARKPSQALACTKKLKTLLGRTIRGIKRKRTNIDLTNCNFLKISERIHKQQKNNKNKIYSLHEPDFRCIAKSKVHKKYEFGSKVNVVSTNKSNFILGALSFLENPHYGKTLKPAIEQVKEFEYKPKNIFVDKGYRGHWLTEE